ncbi:alpha-hydroxy-acid oxidizing protein, partial [Sphingomonas aerophila]
MSIVASTEDFRELAHRRLPPFLFEYIDGGSYSETTLGRNLSDLREVQLRQRVLRDIGTLDPSTELFGRKMALPVALAPIGLAGMNARRGEVQA